MELKQQLYGDNPEDWELLIVPYGIETVVMLPTMCKPASF